ncbi:MAG: 5'/3'-nucleotidase SurE [Candidatus Hydrothermales bacterium]
MDYLRFLLVNDDGIEAEGIKRAERVLSKFGDIFVVAPKEDRSGTSHSISLRKDIKVNKIKENFYSVEGTPVDCVLIAMEALLDRNPDIIISGINYGFNLGEDTLYSGTVAAAREGYLYGIPSIAFSVGPMGERKVFEGGEYYLDYIIRRIIESKLYKENFLLNINLFDLKVEEIKGIKVTRLGKRHYLNPIEKIDENIYRIGGKLKLVHEEDSDSGAVLEGYVSITPLAIEGSDFNLAIKLKKLIE